VPAIGNGCVIPAQAGIQFPAQLARRLLGATRLL